MSAPLVIIGSGQLADFVHRELWTHGFQLARVPDPQSAIPGKTQLALVLQDGWQPSEYQLAETAFQSAGIPWLGAFVSFGEGVIGPFVRPGQEGCSQCAEQRLWMAGNDRSQTWELRQQFLSQGGVLHDAWSSGSALLHLAHIVAAEVERVLQGDRPRTEGHLLLINLRTLKSSLHRVLPSPLCPVCGMLPDDTAELAVIELQASLKNSADSYRTRPLVEMKEILLNEYLDYRTGCFNGKAHDLISPFAGVTVNLPLLTVDEAAGGRSHSYAESELTAILEGLERYCGLTPRGKRTSVNDSYRNLGDQAMNPVRVGVHAPKQYASPDFPFAPFDPDLPIDWVWGYSFLQNKPILVPELLAYYSLGCDGGYVFETSNGCAVGGSLEEAIFYGLLEVVERDAFLMTWYAKMPLPRLDPYSAADEELLLMVERLRVVAGFDLHLFNATMENGIPSVWAIAKNNKQTGVNLICAAGAHLDPVRAVKSAIHELAGMAFTLDEQFLANRSEYERMLHDPYLVRRMEEHSMLYSLPQAEKRLQFLLDDARPLRSFDEEFRARSWQPDLTDDLHDLLQVFRRLDLEVIVVEQTAREMKPHGLHCVKVLIPGMLPMTFGHHLTRLEGLERVLTVPMELGYSQHPLTAADLNPHPHPFP